MATYAVGDIQGCYDELQDLLALIGFGGNDRLWLTGDLVNRGPRSLETLRLIRQLGAQAVTVLGNHDLHLLAVYHHSELRKPQDTLDAVLNAPDGPELLRWLQQQPLLHHDPALDCCLVHAGLPPQWTLEEALRHAREVERVLQSEQAPALFRHMYGNQPACWSPALQGWERLRLIVNYLTRMRFCTPQGCLDLSHKGTLASAPAGHGPWFAHPERLNADCRILFGHWAALEGQASADNVEALDTGCIWGGTLTALRLEDNQRFSVPSRL